MGAAWWLSDRHCDLFCVSDRLYRLECFARIVHSQAQRGGSMKIVAIAGSTIPSDTANSIQVMKACSALAQLGHNLTLLVPETNRKSSVANLKSHYGIQQDFSIEWLTSSSRRLFTWRAVQRARALKP